MVMGFVFFMTITTCMIVGIIILNLNHHEFDAWSYAVGVFSATIAAACAKIVS